jgi:putative transcriptional regulator
MFWVKLAAAARSDAFEAIHNAACGLFSADIIDKTTMREFYVACLEPPALNAMDVKRIRAKANVSQGVLARYMGVNKSTVQKWESADNAPSRMAQKLLNIIDNHGLDVLA